MADALNILLQSMRRRVTRK